MLFDLIDLYDKESETILYTAWLIFFLAAYVIIVL